MHTRGLATVFIMAAAVLVGVLPVTGQTTTSQSNEWTVPRTPDGRPDLQGVWDFRTITPLERPEELAGKEFLTEEEAAVYERETLSSRNADRRDRDESREGFVNGAPVTADLARAYNQFWFDRGTSVVGDRRTSLIVDPPDGRIPPLTPDAEERADARRAGRARAAHGPEDRGLSERCIMGFNSGPPMNPAGYNQNVQLFQTPDYVVLLNEMVHNPRFIPVDGRPHLPQGLRLWVGDSRGHWEGETLVVDTTNFTDKTNFQGSGQDMHLVERFTRVDDGTLLYEYTINDPDSFERPWSVSVPMKTSELPLYEYACHEGNYGMPSSLSGARAVERAAEDAGRRD